MNDGSSPGGTGPEHCCGDLGTRQTPIPCEMPVWVGTVPNGRSLLQDPPQGPRGAPPGSGWSGAGLAGISIRDTRGGGGGPHIHSFPPY